MQAARRNYPTGVHFLTIRKPAKLISMPPKLLDPGEDTHRRITAALPRINLLNGDDEQAGIKTAYAISCAKLLADWRQDITVGLIRRRRSEPPNSG